MVHALEIVHRLLSPSGFLIDIHPVAEHSAIELHHNGKIDQVGDLKVYQWCEDFGQADEALAEIVRRGTFTVEQKAVYVTLTYYDSPAEMGSSFKESILKFARADESVEEEVQQVEELTSRVEELLSIATNETKLALREKDHISRLKPM